MKTKEAVVGGIKYVVEKRALQSPTTFDMVFSNKAFSNGAGVRDFEEGYGHSRESFESCLELLQTGILNEYLLSLPRDVLKITIEFYDLPFNVLVVDYPDEMLVNIFYNNWYRLRRYQPGYIEDWDNSGILQIIDQDMVDKIRQTTTRRNMGSTPNIHLVSRPFKKEMQIARAFQKITNDSIKDQFGEYSKNILTRYQPFRSMFKYTESIKECMKDKMEKFAPFEDIFDGSVIVAGGCVLNMLSGYTPHLDDRSTDIDLFFVGLTEKQALAKLRKLESCASYHRFERSQNAITFTTLGYYKFQFIFRIYKDIEEVLMGFDLDASAVAFDGTTTYGTKAAMYCLKNRVLNVDFSRMSESFAYRITKYAKYKLFSIYVPKLTEYFDKVQRGSSKEGLAALLHWHINNCLPYRVNDYDDALKEKLRQMYRQHSLLNIDKSGEEKTRKEESSRSSSGSDSSSKSSYSFSDSSYGFSDSEDIYDKDYKTRKQYKKSLGNGLSLGESTEKFPIVWKVIRPGEQTSGTFNKIFYSDPEQWYKFEEEIPEDAMKIALEYIARPSTESDDIPYLPHTKKKTYRRESENVTMHVHESSSDTDDDFEGSVPKIAPDRFTTGRHSEDKDSEDSSSYSSDSE